MSEEYHRLTRWQWEKKVLEEKMGFDLMSLVLTERCQRLMVGILADEAVACQSLWKSILAEN